MRPDFFERAPGFDCISSLLCDLELDCRVRLLPYDFRAASYLSAHA